MKRYIIIIGMLVIALGLNAQTTNRGSRSSAEKTTATKSSSEDKKSTRVNPESTPARTSSASQERTNSRESKPAPVYNESRNRETPAVRTTTAPRKTENPSPANRSVNSSGNRPSGNTSTATERTRTVESRSTAGNGSGQRTVNNGNRENTRDAGNSRPSAGNSSVNSNRNREYVPRTEPVYVEKRKVYTTPQPNRAVRTVNKSTSYVYHPVEYRRVYYPYAEPRRIEIIWNSRMYHEYRVLYPHYDYWYYPYGYRIHTISAYDAGLYVGEVARIYGKVYDVWYDSGTDEYYLYFGGPYPFQDFSIVVKGRDARRFSYRPERYFTNRNIAVTGLVSLWDNKPEMIIHKRSQIETYF